MKSTVARLGGCWIEAKEDQFCQTTNLLHDPTRGLRTTPRYASGPLCGWCCYLYSGHQQRLWLAKEGIEIKGGNKQSHQTSQQMLATWKKFFFFIYNFNGDSWFEDHFFSFFFRISAEKGKQKELQAQMLCSIMNWNQIDRERKLHMSIN